MSVTLPEFVDAWRMVSARRSFQGTMPIADLSRLRDLLADTEGEVSYELDFGRDGLGNDYVDVRADVSPRLICQRTLEPFVYPVAVQTRLGLIKLEREESGLPPDYEALLVRDDGRLNPADVIEDELLLMLPLVPINPDSSLPDVVTGHDAEKDPADLDRRENPFAMLRELKK